MAASNINRVTRHREPHEGPGAPLHPQRDVHLQASDRRQHAPQGPSGPVGRQAQLLRRHGLGPAGRELRHLPPEGPPGRHRRPPRVARVGRHRRLRQAPGRRDRRRHASSSWAAATTTAAATGSRFTPESDVPGRHVRFRPGALRAPARRTTTSRSRASGRLIPRPEMKSRPSAHARAGQSIGFSPDTLLGVPAPRGLSLESRGEAVDGTQIEQSAAVQQQQQRWWAQCAAGVIARERPAQAGASPARIAGTRSTSSTTRTSAAFAASSPRRARSALPA